MALLSILIVFAERLLLVGLFFPFSALDKILNVDAAISQAAQVFSSRALATALLFCGFAIEVVMSLAILTGFCDRLAALVLAFYCIVTALLWKQFWKRPGFRLKGVSQDRELFWDFLKNLALAGGFLVLALGATPDGLSRFMAHPLESSDPFRFNP
jgi:putative oxidoreductase